MERFRLDTALENCFEALALAFECYAELLVAAASLNDDLFELHLIHLSEARLDKVRGLGRMVETIER